MFEAVNTGTGEGAVIGRPSRWRIFRLPAAWNRFHSKSPRRCGLGIGASRSNMPETPGDRRHFTGCPDATGHLKLANGPWRRNPAAYAEGHLAMAVTITPDLVEAYSL